MRRKIITYRLFKSTFVLFFGFYFFAGYSYADTKIAMSEAIQQAWENYPSIKKANFDFLSGQSQSDMARWARFPTITASQGKADNSLYSQRQSTTNISVTQPIYSWGKISSGIDSAEANEKSLEIGVDEAKRAIADNVIKLYIRLFITDSLLNISKINVAQHEKLLALVRARVLGQVGTESDLRLAQGRLDVAQSQFIDLKQQRDQLVFSLNIYTGAEREYAVPDDPKIKKLEDIILDTELLAENWPAVKRKFQEIKVAEADSVIARSTGLPSVVARYDRVANQTSGASPVPTSYNQVGVYIQFQPDAGFGSYSRYSAAKNKIDAAKGQYELEKSQFQIELKQNLNSYLSNRGRLNYLDRYANNSKLSVESFYRQYEAGRKTWVELLNQQKESFDAFQTFYNSKQAYLEAYWKLLVLSGNFMKELQLEQNVE